MRELLKFRREHKETVTMFPQVISYKSKSMYILLLEAAYHF